MSNNIIIKKENLIIHKTHNISKEYILGKTLGKGDFSHVRLAIHKDTKQDRAVKIIQKKKVDMKRLLAEISIVSKLSHPSIMEVYEVFEDTKKVYIVSEYCKGGELFDIISKEISQRKKHASLWNNY